LSLATFILLFDEMGLWVSLQSLFGKLLCEIAFSLNSGSQSNVRDARRRGCRRDARAPSGGGRLHRRS
jgi:hypothetical protein